MESTQKIIYPRLSFEFCPDLFKEKKIHCDMLVSLKI